MSKVRTFRKGDKIEGNKGFVYEVLGNETDGGNVRAKLISWPEPTDSRYPWSTAPQRFNASALRRSWTVLEEGPAPRPNNRVTKINAVDVRLNETVRDREGNIFEVTKKKGRKGVWTFTDVDGNYHTLNGTDEVEVLGKRGRPLPKTVHYNPYADPGTVTVQRTTLNPGLGHHACGVVSSFNIYARDVDLVTCDQACGHEAREDARRRGEKA